MMQRETSVCWEQETEGDGGLHWIEIEGVEKGRRYGTIGKRIARSLPKSTRGLPKFGPIIVFFT